MSAFLQEEKKTMPLRPDTHWHRRVRRWHIKMPQQKAVYKKIPP